MNVARLFSRPKNLSHFMDPMRKVPGRQPTPVTHPPPRTLASKNRTLSTSTAQFAPDTNTNPSDRFTTALNQNKEWAAKTSKEEPELLATLATGQRPEILWIGCSDSRCPETTILGLKPGDVFVHRNIANILHGADLSSAAVVEFAVRYLRVKHIVVSGHTGCGGVAAAMGNKQLGILDPWLLPLRQIREQNLTLLQSMTPEEANVKIAELNVHEGCKTLKQKSVVLEAIEERGLQIHGLMYEVGSGMLRQLDTDDSEEVIKARLVSYKTE